ncbi:hypothetical protein DY000_02004764 [Brassica cretica]|uniref:PB1 domain-containing protein n=1 Tax=Brassica cretica TaxID=69181 RepID=A0ABQ7CID5_BRACR|nr:hypothetical protein DY000_02004764 [Brassica cretica]
MGQFVKLVVGVWEQVGQRGWLFLEDPTERKYEIVVHENQTYASLMDLVRTRYSVGLETAVTLTYEFPDWMKADGDISTPPVDVKEDGDFELFMSIRIDLPSTRLMGVLGTDDRDHRGNGDDNLNAHILAANTCRVGLPEGTWFWEGMLGQCFLTASQQFLTNFCIRKDVTIGNKDAFAIMGSQRGPSMETIGDSESTTDSSPGPVDPVPTLYGGGIIRLRDGPESSPTIPNKALSIVEPQATKKASPLLEYLSKGKENVCNEDEGEKKRRYASGRLSPRCQTQTSLALFLMQTPLTKVQRTKERSICLWVRIDRQTAPRIVLQGKSPILALFFMPIP